MRSFIMVYHEAFFDLTVVERWADSSSLVAHWRYDIPGCIYLLSEATAVVLSKNFRTVGLPGPFLITEVAGEVAGTMLPETWVMLTDKKPSPLTDNIVEGEASKFLQPVA